MSTALSVVHFKFQHMWLNPLGLCNWNAICLALRSNGESWIVALERMCHAHCTIAHCAVGSSRNFQSRNHMSVIYLAQNEPPLNQPRKASQTDNSGVVSFRNVCLFPHQMKNDMANPLKSGCCSNWCNFSDFFFLLQWQPMQSSTVDLANALLHCTLFEAGTNQKSHYVLMATQEGQTHSRWAIHHWRRWHELPRCLCLASCHCYINVCTILSQQLNHFQATTTSCQMQRSHATAQCVVPLNLFRSGIKQQACNFQVVAKCCDV